jgi:hypothetical protein
LVFWNVTICHFASSFTTYQGEARLYLARFIVFLKLDLRAREDDRDVGAHKPNAP